jgi:hypothetical protein
MAEKQNRCLLILGMLLMLSAFGLPSIAIAGDHANAKLIFHLPPDLQYTRPNSGFIGDSDLRNPDDAVTNASIPVVGEDGYIAYLHARVWFVLACFRDSPGPVDVGGYKFGFGDYDAAQIEIIEYSHCFSEGIEIPTSGWPGPNEGVSVVETCHPSCAKHTEIAELYWFASYAYGPVQIPLARCPVDNDRFDYPGIGTSELPSLEDFIYNEEDLGIIGFGMEGYNPFSPTAATGACCDGSYCDIVTLEDCDNAVGTYQGDRSDCFPNPCEAALEATWGELKDKFDYY